jgi:hypothetical protein
VEKYGTAKQATDDSIIQWMCIVCWITKDTDTHSEYMILFAFPEQQWLHKCTAMLHVYVHFLSFNITFHHFYVHSKASDSYERDAWF